MKKKIVLILSMTGISFLMNAQEGRKLSRAESFWGLHFDRHSELTDSHLGATLTEAMVDSMLRLARPDFIQVDSKGHPGVSSYPTKVGQQAQSYDQDPLLLLRRVTERHHVALYVHHSGVRDENYVRLHPDEARRKPDGKPDNQQTSLWRPYARKLLIPQLKEIALNYKADGAWVDGECWAVSPDYQPAALEEFKRTTGITRIPLLANDPDYKTLLEFNRRKFIDYLRYYTGEIHKVAPSFQICSNFAFSALIPEPVPEDVGLDFLSGDFSSINPVNDANFHIRCLAGQRKPFDLMAWSFTNINSRPIPKTSLQLCQEGAVVISMGGAFQIYFQQNRDISFQPAMFGVMKEVADFMLPRREYCKEVTPVPQIALFYSTTGWKNRVNEVYRLTGVSGLQGTLNALLDGQHSVEILMSHHMRQRMDQYPLIVVPEWEVVEPDILEDLKTYVREGGKLALIGARITGMFDDLLGTKPAGLTQQASHSLGYGNHFVSISSPYRKVECLPDVRVLSRFYETNDLRFPCGIAATCREYGKGMVAGVYADIGSAYLSTSSPVLRGLLSDLVGELFPDELVRVEGSHRVNVVTTEKDGKLLIQLVNTSGDHANPNVKGIDEIPVLRDLKISVLTGQRPSSVILQPEGIPLRFDHANGKSTFVLPELKIHSVIGIMPGR
ncbi:MAG: hypothetical protein AB2L24_16710 [Mangrovibacterium sp.]